MPLYKIPIIILILIVIRSTQELRQISSESTRTHHEMSANEQSINESQDLSNNVHRTPLADGDSSCKAQNIDKIKKEDEIKPVKADDCSYNHHHTDHTKSAVAHNDYNCKYQDTDHVTSDKAYDCSFKRHNTDRLESVKADDCSYKNDNAENIDSAFTRSDNTYTKPDNKNRGNSIPDDDCSCKNHRIDCVRIVRDDDCSCKHVNTDGGNSF